MRNKFSGHCFICKKEVGKGEGFFQNTNRMGESGKGIPHKWLLRCEKCVGKGNPVEILNELKIDITWRERQ